VTVAGVLFPQLNPLALTSKYLVVPVYALKVVGLISNLDELAKPILANASVPVVPTVEPNNATSTGVLLASKICKPEELIAVRFLPLLSLNMVSPLSVIPILSVPPPS